MTTRYLTTAEVAQEIRVSSKTVQNWRYLEEPYGPPYVYIGGRVLYPADKFDDWSQGINESAQ